jgi:hypothetical protein
VRPGYSLKRRRKEGRSEKGRKGGRREWKHGHIHTYKHTHTCKIVHMYMNVYIWYIYIYIDRYI